MKVRASLKKRSADCKIVRRHGTLYVINKKNPKEKRHWVLLPLQEVLHLQLSLKEKLIQRVKRSKGESHGLHYVKLELYSFFHFLRKWHFVELGRPFVG